MFQFMRSECMYVLHMFGQHIAKTSKPWKASKEVPSIFPTMVIKSRGKKWNPPKKRPLKKKCLKKCHQKNPSKNRKGNICCFFSIPESFPPPLTQSPNFLVCFFFEPQRSGYQRLDSIFVLGFPPNVPDLASARQHGHLENSKTAGAETFSRDPQKNRAGKQHDFWRFLLGLSYRRCWYVHLFSTLFRFLWCLITAYIYIYAYIWIMNLFSLSFSSTRWFLDVHHTSHFFPNKSNVNQGVFFSTEQPKIDSITWSNWIGDVHDLQYNLEPRWPPLKLLEQAGCKNTQRKTHAVYEYLFVKTCIAGWDFFFKQIQETQKDILKRKSLKMCVAIAMVLCWVTKSIGVNLKVTSGECINFSKYSALGE